MTLLLLFTDSSLTDAMGLDMASASMVGEPQVEKSFREMTLKEIGEVMEVSESRICQMHSEIIKKLEYKLKDWKHS